LDRQWRLLVDPVTITGILAAGNQAMGLLKTAAEALKAAGKPEAVGALAEVQISMMDLLQKQQTLIEENRSLRDRVAQLEEELKVKSELEFHHNSYWRRTSPDSLEGPFSSVNWDVHRKLVRMHTYNRDVFDGVEKVHFYEQHTKDGSWVPAEFLRANGVPGEDRNK